MMYVEKVEKSLIAHKLFQSGAHIGIAVSGGADSVFLLHALYSLAKRLDFKLSVLHLEHGLRGRASRRDMCFVQDTCKALEVPCITQRVDTRRYAREKGWSLEQAARALRYDFFERSAKEFGLNRIALAHHKSDQAETVLLNLTRGSGMQGLVGMQPFRPPWYIRPMLDLEKREILEALKAAGLPYRTDRTNWDIHMSRNRIRRRIMPQLAKINPKAEGSIVRTAEMLMTDEAFMQSAVDTEYHARVKNRNGEVQLSLDGWETVHPALQRRIIRRILHQYFSLLDVEFIHIEGIIGISFSENGKRTRIPSEVFAAKAYDSLLFFREPAAQATSIPIEIGRKVELEFSGYRFLLDWPKSPEYEAGTECLNADRLDRMVLRTSGPNDSIVPLGMTGKKRLSDYLSDRKVPRHQRKHLPVFAVNDAVMMVTGVGISEMAKVETNTARICRIRYERI